MNIFGSVKCFIAGVVNWEMSEKQRKLYPIFYKMFNRIKRVYCLKEKKKTISHHVNKI